MKKNTGFTLVETLVAVAILMIAIAGPLTVAEKGLSAAIYARDQLTASYLAQDAVEEVKNMTDTNELAGNDLNTWLKNNGTGGISNLVACTSGFPCTIDTYTNDIEACSGQCAALSSTTVGYRQLQSPPAGQASIFTRYFYISTTTLNVTDGNAAAKVVVNVNWPGSTIGGSGGVILIDMVYNAYQ